MKSEQLYFGFEAYANALAARLAAGSETSAFVLSISGPWGSGKTTLMNEVIERFPVDKFVLRYNAWSSSQRHEVWRTFFVAVVAALGEELNRKFPRDAQGSTRGKEGDRLETLLDDSEQALYRAFVKEMPGELQLDTGNLLKTGAKLALKFVPWGDAISTLSGFLSKASSSSEKKKPKEDTAKFTSDDLESILGVFKRDMAKEHVARIESLEQFGGIVRALVSEFTSIEKRLLIAIDDIDRCLPEQSLEILEAIKLFLDLPHVGYVIASDNSIVQHGLDIRYKQNQTNTPRVRADNYIEKMVDLSFSIPTPNSESFEKFVASELSSASLLKPSLTMIEAGIGRTPRSWIRFSNRLALKSDILKGAGVIDTGQEFSGAQAALLVKAELLSYRWPHFMRKIRGFEQLRELEVAVSKANISESKFSLECKEQGSVIIALRARTGYELKECEHIDDALIDRSLLECLAVGNLLGSESVSVAFGQKVFSLDI